MRFEEYRNSVNLGKIEVSTNDLKLTDGTYKFTRDQYDDMKNFIESGWRLPTKEEFGYIHSLFVNLGILRLVQSGDYWLYGESIPHPVNTEDRQWDLFPCVFMWSDGCEYAGNWKGEKLRIRLVKDL